MLRWFFKRFKHSSQKSVSVPLFQAYSVIESTLSLPINFTKSSHFIASNTQLKKWQANYLVYVQKINCKSPSIFRRIRTKSLTFWEKKPLLHKLSQFLSNYAVIKLRTLIKAACIYRYARNSDFSTPNFQLKNWHGNYLYKCKKSQK